MPPNWKEGGGWFVFEVSEQAPDLSLDLTDIRFLFYFRDATLYCEPWRALLSESESSRTGCSPMLERKKKTSVTQRVLSGSATALCPTITPYDWQIDLAEALGLGIDATVIAGTGSGKTLPWALPLLLEQNRDRICLVISPLNLKWTVYDDGAYSQVEWISLSRSHA